MLLKSSSVSGVTPPAFDVSTVNYIKEFWSIADATTTTVSETFAPADVNTSTNQITLGDISMNITSPTIASSAGMYGYFLTTGTLPSGIIGGKKYYPYEVASGVYEFYPETTQSDMGASLPSSLPHEVPLPAQNWFQQKNSVVFTDQGTGTHTFSTDPLANLVLGRIEGYRMEAEDTDLHQALPVAVLGGVSYVSARSTKSSKNNNGNYEKYGNRWQFSPESGGTDLAVKQNVVGSKRTIAVSAIMRPNKTEILGNRKAYILSTNVNTTTDVLTYDGEEGDNLHRFDTGDSIQILEHTGDTLPSGLSVSTNYFVRDLSGSTFSLFDTKVNAENTGSELGRIDITNQGTTGFTVFEQGTIADNFRLEYLMELLEPDGGGNAASIQVTRASPSSVNGGKYSNTALALNGDLTVGTSANWFLGEPDSILKVDVKLAPDGNPPTRSDNASSFAGGIVYMTQNGSSTVRFHDTYAQAVDAVGVATSSLTDEQMIKFTDIGDSEIMVWYADRAAAFLTHEPSNLLRTNTKFEYDGLFHKYDYIVDYGDASGFVKYLMYVDNVLVEEVTSTVVANGSTAAAVNDAIGTFFNSAQGHASFEGDLMAIGIFSDETATSAQVWAEMQSSGYNAAMLSEYNIASQLPDEISDLSGTASGTDTAIFKWSQPNSFIQPFDYTIEENINDGGYSTVADGVSGVTGYTKTGLAAEDEISVRATAVSLYGNSVASSIVSVTTDATSNTGYDASGISGYFADYNAREPANNIDGGGNLSTFSDSSGNGYDATAVTAASSGTRTLNGENTIDFDRSNVEYYEIADVAFRQISNGANTVFIVFQADDNSNDQALLNKEQSGGGWTFDIDYDASNVIRTQNGGGLNLSVTKDTGVHILAYRRSGTTQEVWLDGSGSSATNENATDIVLDSAIRIGRSALGGSTALDGAIPRILVFNQALSDTNLNNVGNGLATDSGTTWTNI